MFFSPLSSRGMGRDLQLTTGEFAKGIGGQMTSLGERLVRLANLHKAMTERKNKNMGSWKIIMDGISRFMWQLLQHKVMGESGNLEDVWLEKEKDLFCHLSEDRVCEIFSKYQKKLDSTDSPRLGTPKSSGNTPNNRGTTTSNHIQMLGDFLHEEKPDLGDDDVFFSEEVVACEHILQEFGEKLAAIYNYYTNTKGRDNQNHHYSMDRFQFLAFAEDIKFIEKTNYTNVIRTIFQVQNDRNIFSLSM